MPRSCVRVETLLALDHSRVSIAKHVRFASGLPSFCAAHVQHRSLPLKFKAIAGDDAVFNIRTTVVVVIVDIDPAQI